MKSLYEMFVVGLENISYAESQIVKNLPEMIIASLDDEMIAIFQEHLAQTKEQIARLSKIGKTLNENLNTKTNPIIDSIIAQGKEITKKEAKSHVNDAALIAQVQVIEHYEIAVYGNLVSWAKVMRHDEESELLSNSLDEEKEAKEKLTKIAEGGILQDGINAMASDN